MPKTPCFIVYTLPLCSTDESYIQDRGEFEPCIQFKKLTGRKISSEPEKKIKFSRNNCRRDLVISREVQPQSDAERSYRYIYY